MRKPYRYQIQVGGHIHSPVYNEIELGDQWMRDIGTCPVMCMVDTKTGDWVPPAIIPVITMIDGQYIDEISRLRMHINHSYSDAIESRKRNLKVDNS